VAKPPLPEDDLVTSNLALKEERPVTNLPYRDKVTALEKALIEEFDQIDMTVEHLFAHGTYTRVLYIPKGTILTGKLHKHSCINIITKGKMVVATDEGDLTVEAPTQFVSGAGVKKAAIALEDTIWINVHINEDGEQDLDVIEDRTLYKEGYKQLEQECDLARSKERAALEQTEV